MEKIVLALVFAAKRLQRYFQAHPIAVITDQPIKQIISRPDVAGRLQKWSIMLGEHNITYRPRTSVKGQILADFLVERPDEAPPDTSVGETLQEPWTLFMDGSSCVDGSDSKLVANKVLGTYVAKEENMIKYLEKAKSLGSGDSSRGRWTNMDDTDNGILKDGTLPDDRKEARKLCIKARQYELLEGILYRWSFLKPWLRCVRPLQADYVIREIHEGSCRIDIDGPFPEGPGKVKFLIVAMDYFTKWIEAKAVATISGSQELGEGIKAHLGEGNKSWIKELSRVLWAHRTMIKSSHCNTSFSLTYETEAIILAEVGMPTYHTAVVDAVHNDEELQLNLDLLEERHERAAISEANAKLKITKYYNVRVRGVTFRPGDFVYLSNDASHVVDGGKLGPKWEGPYEVTEALGDGAYRLSYLGLCGGIRQHNRQPLGSDSRHEYGDAVGSGVMSGTNPMGATNHPALLLFSARLMLAAMASSNNISSLNAQGSLGSRTSGYTRIFS
ncbi:reverse transcriptase domain-containing protein [Tanacetum coccineum]